MSYASVCKKLGIFSFTETNFLFTVSLTYT